MAPEAPRMRRTLALLLTILLSIPIAAANWTYRGNNEPDTVFDDPAWNYFEPDTSPSTSVNKLYFGGFARVGEVHYNPNVGVLGSRFQPATAIMSAFLGFWKDCNKDGYVGLAESAALEYRRELLLDTSVCPVVPPTTNQAIYPHNDGTWVREFIWVGPRSDAIGSPSQNPTNFYADHTGVWGDWGLPGAAPPLVCPGGNFGIRSTGAFIESVDCVTYFRTVRTLNAADPSGDTVGGWEMHDVSNSPSPLNIDNPAYYFLYGPVEPEGHPQEGDYRGFNGGFFGRDRDNHDERERAVTIVDCDSRSLDTSPEVNTPGSLTDSATYPSVYESLNDTWNVYVQPDSGCAAGGNGDQGLAYPSVEGYTEPTFSEAGRVVVDFAFEFSTGSRNFPNTAVSGTCRANQAFTQGALGYCAPGDLGLGVWRDDGPVGAAWRTNGILTPYVTTVREQSRGNEADFGGWYFTFYARVGEAARTFGGTQNWPGSVDVYGREACGANTTGIHGSWNCDAGAWETRCSDPVLGIQPAQCYRKGMLYHLRDIDCWDNTVVRGSGIHAGLSDLSASGPCVGHPSNEGIDLPN